MSSNYTLGSADPVLRHSRKDITLSLKAALLTRPRVVLQPALVLDSVGMNRILSASVAGPSEVGFDAINELASASDSYSGNRPILSLATSEDLRNGLEYFEAWSGVGGRLREDPVYSSILSRSIDTSKSPRNILERHPEFKVGVEAIDKIFLRRSAIERTASDFRNDFRPTLAQSLEVYSNKGDNPKLKELSKALLNKIEETEEFSRSFIIRECQRIVGQDIYAAGFGDPIYRVFREGIIDQNWRICHAKANRGFLFEGFQEKRSILRRVFPFWNRPLPSSPEPIEVRYAGKYLSEVDVKDILELRKDRDYIKQLEFVKRSLHSSRTSRLDKGFFEAFLDKLAEAFPSSRGKSQKDKLVRISLISQAIFSGAEIGVRLLSNYLTNVDPNIILLGDIAWISGTIVNLSIGGIGLRASEKPSLNRTFVAYGLDFTQI